MDSATVARLESKSAVRDIATVTRLRMYIDVSIVRGAHQGLVSSIPPERC